MIEYLYIALITLIPGVELRGSIPVGIWFLGLDPATVFLVSVLANIAIIPLTFIFLDLFWGFLNKFEWFKRFASAEKKIGKKTFLGLLIFVAVPLPGTGAYTGALLTKLFNLDKKMSFVAIALGVAVAGLFVAFISIGLLEIFKWML